MMTKSMRESAFFGAPPAAMTGAKLSTPALRVVPQRSLPGGGRAQQD